MGFLMIEGRSDSLPSPPRLLFRSHLPLAHSLSQLPLALTLTLTGTHTPSRSLTLSHTHTQTQTHPLRVITLFLPPPWEAQVLCLVVLCDREALKSVTACD